MKRWDEFRRHEHYVSAIYESFKTDEDRVAADLDPLSKSATIPDMDRELRFTSQFEPTRIKISQQPISQNVPGYCLEI